MNAFQLFMDSFVLLEELEDFVFAYFEFFTHLGDGVLLTIYIFSLAGTSVVAHNCMSDEFLHVFVVFFLPTSFPI